MLTVDSPGFERLTTNDFADEEPEWSPDGTLILFDSNRAGSNDLYVTNRDGTRLTRLTHGPAKEDHGSWSPDGRLIAYQHEEAGNTDVYVMRSDGSERVRLTAPGARAKLSQPTSTSACRATGEPPKPERAGESYLSPA